MAIQSASEQSPHELVCDQGKGDGRDSWGLQRDGLEKNQDVVTISCNGVCHLTLQRGPFFRLNLGLRVFIFFQLVSLFASEVTGTGL